MSREDSRAQSAQGIAYNREDSRALLLIIALLALLLAAPAWAANTTANLVGGTIGTDAIGASETTDDTFDFKPGQHSADPPACSDGSPCPFTVYDAACSSPFNCANRENIDVKTAGACSGTYPDRVCSLTIKTRNAETPNCTSCSFAAGAKVDILIRKGSIYSPGGSDVALSDGGTGASLADPDAVNQRLCWNNTSKETEWCADISDSKFAVDWVDAKSDYYAAGVVTTTTGSIDSGTNALTVVSSAGYTSNMGIAIAGAGAAGVELITYISSIDGNVFTLHDNASTTVSGAAVRHDDTRALQNAINSAKHVYMPQGTYNVSSTIGTITTSGQIIQGAGSSTILRKLDTTVFTIVQQVRSLLFDFSIVQIGTPTAGGGIKVGDDTHSVSHGMIRDVVVQSTYVGIYARNDSAVVYDKLSISGCIYADVLIDEMVGTPYWSGANIWADSFIQSSVAGAGIYIKAGDVNQFDNIYFWGSKYDVKIDGSSNYVTVQSFVNCAFDGGWGDASATVFDISNVASGGDFDIVRQISIVGGHIGNTDGKGLVVSGDTGVGNIIVAGVQFLNIGLATCDIHTNVRASSMFRDNLGCSYVSPFDVTSSSGKLPLANGGTGVSLSDPNADQLLGWDDSAGYMAFFTLGANLSTNGTTLNVTPTEYSVGNCGTTKTISWADANVQYATLDQSSCAITFSNPTAGQTLSLALYQNASGGSAATWVSTISWAGGSAPTLSTGANAVDWIICKYSNSRYFCDVNKGF